MERRHWDGAGGFTTLEHAVIDRRESPGMDVPKKYPRSSEYTYEMLRSYDWEGDLLNVTDAVVSKFRDATDTQVLQHYQTDFTELREFLEAKRAGKELRRVVTCGECKYWEGDWIPCGSRDGSHYCAVLDGFKPANWFCADGERKEES